MTAAIVPFVQVTFRDYVTDVGAVRKTRMLQVSSMMLSSICGFYTSHHFIRYLMTLTTAEDNTQYSLSCGYWTEVHYVLRRNKTLYVGVTYL